MLDLHSRPWARYTLLIMGWLCVILGIIGLVMPMMPGAVFLALAAWFFSRSSERFHLWLMQHRHLGPVVRAWKTGEGFDRTLRRRILLIMWGSMVLSMAIIAKLWAVGLLSVCGIVASIYLYRQPLHPATSYHSK
ncbi:MAG: DUF454 domain-containing protein [Oleiphilus sp.]|nr:MAG: DUF454 domain-containing protein [Oleiphilus sp.]